MPVAPDIAGSTLCFMASQPTLLSSSVKHHGQATLVPPENLRRQRVPKTQQNPARRKSKTQLAPVVCIVEEAHKDAELEPPPSYSEAIAWSPPVHLDTAPVLLLPRPSHSTPTSSPTAAQRKKEMEHRVQTTTTSKPSPSPTRGQYDGLTKRRTKPVAVTPVKPPPSAPQILASSTQTTTPVRRTFDPLTRTHSRPLSERIEPTTVLVDLPAILSAAAAKTRLPEPVPSERVVTPVASTSKSASEKRPLPQLPVQEEDSGAAPIDHGDITELDVLLARIEVDADYNDLTLLNDIMGSAKRGPTVDDLDIPEGTVQVERRRVTRDGRVKLKLGLMGTHVDRCCVCLTQFKADEKAVLVQRCGHAVHSDCARKWIARSATCPQCRQPLT